MFQAGIMVLGTLAVLLQVEYLFELSLFSTIIPYPVGRGYSVL